MRVAYQGEPGAFSEEAVAAMYPSSEPVPLASFDEVFDAVTAGTCDRGVVPIENSLFGSVHQNADLLLEHNLRIVAEFQLRIRHQLLALPGARMQDLTRISSHPQALGQCRDYLKKHLPQAGTVAAHDTAGAARLVQESQDPTCAAIASRRAAERYSLKVVAENIENNALNFTRFLGLCRSDQDGDQGLASSILELNGWKTSILYAQQENMPGGLFQSLAPFANRNVDLARIESRPLVGSPGQYVFYLDLVGRESDQSVQDALEELEDRAAFLVVLGSYRRGGAPTAKASRLDAPTTQENLKKGRAQS